MYLIKNINDFSSIYKRLLDIGHEFHNQEFYLGKEISTPKIVLLKKTKTTKGLPNLKLAE